MLTEVDAISAEGSLLIPMVKDTTEADAVTMETLNRRVQSRGSGSHPIAGSWRAYKSKRSSNGSIIKYKCTAGGFSGQTPPGENFDAKFDGDDDPVADDPGHTMVSVKRLKPRPVGLTHKRKRKIVSISPMSVAAGGESMHGRFREQGIHLARPSTLKNNRSANSPQPSRFILSP